MKYIEYDKDLKSSKVSEIVNELSDTDNQVLEIIESEAISLVDSYLGNYYDTDMIFNGKYDYPYIKRIVKDFMILFLYERIENEPPAYIVEKTDKHLEWLREVGKRQIVPNIPTLGEGSKSVSFYGYTGRKFI